MNEIYGGLKIRTWIIIGIIVLVGILTNPGIDRHRASVKEVLIKAIGKSTDSIRKDDETNGLADIGLALSTMMLNTLVETAVSSQNYLVFSLTKVTYGDGSRIIGIGIFGNVFLFDDKLDPDKLKKQ